MFYCYVLFQWWSVVTEQKVICDPHLTDNMSNNVIVGVPCCCCWYKKKYRTALLIFISASGGSNITWYYTVCYWACAAVSLSLCVGVRVCFMEQNFFPSKMNYSSLDFESWKQPFTRHRCHRSRCRSIPLNILHRNLPANYHLAFYAGGHCLCPVVKCQLFEHLRVSALPKLILMRCDIRGSWWCWRWWRWWRWCWGGGNSWWLTVKFFSNGSNCKDFLILSCWTSPPTHFSSPLVTFSIFLFATDDTWLLLLWKQIPSQQCGAIKYRTLWNVWQHKHSLSLSLNTKDISFTSSYTNLWPQKFFLGKSG